MKKPTRLFFDYMVLQLSLRGSSDGVILKFCLAFKAVHAGCMNLNFFSFRPVGHCGPMSVEARTTALAYAPESMQALSFPERLLPLFRVSFKVSFTFCKHP